MDIFIPEKRIKRVPDEMCPSKIVREHPSSRRDLRTFQGSGGGGADQLSEQAHQFKGHSARGFARWVGIIAAVIAGVSALWWMPFYPVWAFVYIVITALVVYALAVYGGDRERVS